MFIVIKSSIMEKKQKEKCEMDKLEALVNSLEKLPPRGKDEKIVKKLQEILELFLRNYYVEFGTF